MGKGGKQEGKGARGRLGPGGWGREAGAGRLGRGAGAGEAGARGWRLGWRRGVGTGELAARLAPGRKRNASGWIDILRERC